ISIEFIAPVVAQELDERMNFTRNGSRHLDLGITGGMIKVGIKGWDKFVAFRSAKVAFLPFSHLSRSEREQSASSGSLLNDGHYVFNTDEQPSVVFHLHQKLLSQDFVIQDAGPPFGRDNIAPDRRHILNEILIGIVLITEAAFKAPAAARNLGRIERSLLQLGHPHRNRGHFLEMRVAAKRLSAIAIVR